MLFYIEELWICIVLILYYYCIHIKLCVLLKWRLPVGPFIENKMTIFTSIYAQIWPNPKNEIWNLKSKSQHKISTKGKIKIALDHFFKELSFFSQASPWLKRSTSYIMGILRRRDKLVQTPNRCRHRSITYSILNRFHYEHSKDLMIAMKSDPLKTFSTQIDQIYNTKINLTEIKTSIFINVVLCYALILLIMTFFSSWSPYTRIPLHKKSINELYLKINNLENIYTH